MKTQRGFTLVEITVSFAILAVALSVLMQGLLTLTHARQSASEKNSTNWCFAVAASEPNIR